jgi:outer membrane protein assembly factor BamB
MTWSRDFGAMRLGVLAPLCVLALTGLTACATSETTTGSASPEVRASRDVELDRQWVAPGPRNPQAAGADTRGVVAVGRYGPTMALDSRGHVDWERDLAAEGEQTFGPVALNADLAVTPVYPGRVVALERETGETRWSTELQDPADVAVDPRGGQVVAALSSGGVLAAFDSRDGRARWTAHLPAFDETAQPVGVHVRGNHVVAVWGDNVNGCRVQAFDAASGAPQWSFAAPRFLSGPTFTHDAVVLAENLDLVARPVRSRVVRLDLANGEEVWSHELHGWFLPALATVAARDVALVVDQGGTITELDVTDGSVRWRRPTKRMQFAASPQIVGRTVAMTTYGTGLVALAAADGRTVPNDEPGPVQLEVTFEGSAAAGDHLYLLAGRSRGAGEIWMLSAPA